MIEYKVIHSRELGLFAADGWRVVCVASYSFTPPSVTADSEGDIAANCYLVERAK